MNELLNRVSEKYDYVIIDTSPAGILTDAVALTPYADAVILSIRQDYAPSRLIESVVQSLSNGRAELIGCIFNYVDERASITESMATGASADTTGTKENKYGNQRRGKGVVPQIGQGGAK
jgi:Mrp family chromosome partitioning ATPase